MSKSVCSLLSIPALLRGDIRSLSRLRLRLTNCFLVLLHLDPSGFLLFDLIPSCSTHIDLVPFDKFSGQLFTFGIGHRFRVTSDKALRRGHGQCHIRRGFTTVRT